MVDIHIIPVYSRFHCNFNIIESDILKSHDPIPTSNFGCLYGHE